MSIFTFRSPGLRGGLTELQDWPPSSPRPPGAPLTGPGPPASNTKSGAHKSPGAPPRGSPSRTQAAAAAGGCCSSGLSRGSSGGTRAAPAVLSRGGPPARHPGAPRPGALDSRSTSSFQPGPRLPGAASAPGRVVALPPAWPRVAENGRTREVWGCCRWAGADEKRQPPWQVSYVRRNPP